MAVQDRGVRSRAGGAVRALRRFRTVAKGGVPTHRHTALERRLDEAVADRRRLSRTVDDLGRRLTNHKRLLDEQKARTAKLATAATAASTEVAGLQARVAELESALQQERGLALRTAELADVVTHLLAAAAAGDPAELRSAAQAYTDGL